MLPSIVLTRSTHERLSLLISLLRSHGDNDLLEFIDQELARAELVNDADIGSRIATLGSRLEYRDNLAGTTVPATLVYPSHEHGIAGGLSVLTPAGACLLGLSEGQSMQYWTESGLKCDVTLLHIFARIPDSS